MAFFRQESPYSRSDLVAYRCPQGICSATVHPRLGLGAAIQPPAKPQPPALVGTHYWMSAVADAAHDNVFSFCMHISTAYLVLLRRAKMATIGTTPSRLHRSTFPWPSSTQAFRDVVSQWRAPTVHSQRGMTTHRAISPNLQPFQKVVSYCP